MEHADAETVGVTWGKAGAGVLAGAAWMLRKVRKSAVIVEKVDALRRDMGAHEKRAAQDSAALWGAINELREQGEKNAETFGSLKEGQEQSHEWLKLLVADRLGKGPGQTR